MARNSTASNPALSTNNSPGRPKAQPERDLRRDLLITSRTLLDEAGPGALSMREVARRAGCTHQAPYHYFADRESILAALVAEGFEALAQRLEVAHALADTQGVRAALIASASAYVGFAASHVGVFRIMFRPDICNPLRFAEVQAAGTRAHSELLRLTELVHGKKASPVLATVLWAHVHGLACLLVDGPLASQFASDAAVRGHLESVGEQFADLILRPLPARAHSSGLKVLKR